MPKAAATPLAEYTAKRSFGDTPEPAPQALAARTGPLVFVVQQHAARAMHYDLRLELDGVFKSWAVPKGLAIQPGERHLAVPTEDHPLDYGPFEGVIPKGQYGAGSVVVWDCGFYSPDEKAEYAFDDRARAEARVRAELEAGKLSFFLLGVKAKGSYALIRTKDKTWLLIKHKDAWGTRSPTGASVLSGRTVADVGTATNLARVALERLVACGPQEPWPEKLAPMLAGTGTKPFADPAWSFEPKLDGYRVLAFVKAGEVRLRSRGGLDLTAAFPSIVADLARQPLQPIVLDGEVIALANGRPSFGALQNRARLKAKIDIDAAERANPTLFFCFDILHVQGRNLRAATYEERRRWLTQCLLPTERVQIVHGEADGDALYRAAIEAGFEGVMAKRRAGKYGTGRSDDWLKIKAVQSAEFVVGGYTVGKNSRGKSFGALVLGRWNGAKLEPVGNVGSGFDDKALAAISRELGRRAVEAMPFATLPEALGPMRWVKPELVAEVEFQGWTDDGHLRAPVFLRLRDDVDPRSVRVKSAEPLLLEQLAGKGQNLTLASGAHRIKLTHLDKVLWPAHRAQPAVTKRDLLVYLAAIAPYMLPHLANRPITVIRMPDGIHGESFFQKHWQGTPLPEFISTVTIEEDDGPSKPYILCNNVETLVWLGQMGALEYHVPHFSVPGPGTFDRSTLDRPNYVTFDLDPYIYAGTEAAGEEPVFNKAAFAKAREVALHLNETLGSMSLRAFVKTTGKTGLHIFVPIERGLSSEQTREVCRLVGQHLLRRHPQDITMDWQIPKRTGKIFLDHNMNGYGRTLNAAYSPRRVADACVAMPVAWEMLPRVMATDFTIRTAVEHVRQQGDAWRDIFAAMHNLNTLLGAKVG